ncbi:MAG: NAD(P)H-binding protein [Chloroflexi bacterium]|nr:NAD(P)H-binding protein [Chloroflexota bacterium]
MHVLVVGGTGFLGYFAVHELLRRGHSVSILALPPLPEQGFFPPQVSITLGNLDDLSDNEVRAHLRGVEGVVFAAGADDRIIPRAPAYPFFHHANVEVCERFFRLARQAGVGRGVLLSSYFAHFDRLWPALRLAYHHPYIRSRREQALAALAAAMPDLQLVILELPYIFGAMPGRVPLWSPLVNLVRRSRVVFYPRGGSNMVAVGRVAEAIVGGVECGEGGRRYLMGDENVAWADFLQRLSLYACGRPKPVVTVPDFLVRQQMKAVAAKHLSEGREAGLDPVEFTKLQTARLFFDPTPSRQALGYGQGGLDQALRDTVAACPPSDKVTFW